MRKRKCMFCLRAHTRTPDMCHAKGRIMRAYLDAGLEMWQVLHGIHRGILKLEAEAAGIVMADQRRRRQAARRRA